MLVWNASYSMHGYILRCHAQHRLAKIKPEEQRPIGKYASLNHNLPNR